MTTQMIICLGIFLCVVIAFATNILPLAQTAMIGMVLMILTGCLDGKTAISYFSSSTVVMLGGIFIVASAFSKTQVIDKVSHCVVRVSKGSLLKVTAGYVLMALLLGQLLNSSSALFCMIYPLVVSCCKELKASPSKIMYPLGITCMATGGIIPSTAAVSMCEVWRPFFDAYEISEYTYNVMDYCIARLPLAFLVVILAIFFAPRFMPDKASAESVAATNGRPAEKKAAVYTPLQEKIVIFVFVAVILGIAFGGNFGLPGWLVCMVGALIIIASKAIKGNEIYSSMGLTVIFLCVGGTGMASALQQTGAADLIGKLLIGIFGSHPNGYLVGLVFFFIPCIVAQFLTNSPTNYIFVPICLMACKAFGGNPVGPMFLVISGALCGFVTPMANPTASIMYGVGEYKLSEIIKVGPLILAVVGLVSAVWVMTMYPLY